MSRLRDAGLALDLDLALNRAEIDEDTLFDAEVADLLPEQIDILKSRIARKEAHDGSPE